MKRFLIVFLLVVSVLYSQSQWLASAANLSDSISPDTDLCGGTGGNGQIVRVGSNEFTLQRNK